ncbi:MAG TPA: helix-turn-helix domain-containing protein [Pyrinomonadaceae bacterium]|nr:helix-turn-helix domain-containing protein [Pyrinomonadaceae bacterium]
MRRLGKEKLADYVRRVMKQKQLKLRDVERRAGGEITNGYISGIINGRISNISLEKLKALAKGLEVDVYELFSAAMDEPRQLAEEVSSYAQPDVLWLLGIMQEIAATPELLKILHELVQMTPKDREIVVKVIESIGKTKQRPARRAAGHKRA